MAIEFVGGNTATKVGGSSASTIALNSGLTGGIASSVSEGDLVIAVFAAGSTSDLTLSITDGASDYTLIDSELYVDDTRDTNLRVAYKFMGATPDTAVTFGAISSADDSGAMAVYVFRGVDQTTPLDGVTPTSSTAQNTVLVDPPSITPSSAGAFIVVAGAGGHSAGSRTFGSTDLTDFRTAGSNDVYDATVGVGHKPDWTSGAFDPVAWTFSLGDNGAYSNAAICFVLRPASGGAKTLTADAGSYAVSGTSSSLERGYVVAANGGSYAVTGTAASLEFGREVLALGDSYSVSGTSATLTKTWKATADAGTYTINGVASSLEVGREVLADSGSYAVSGVNASLEFGREVLADSDSYSVSGTSATLTYASSAKILVAEAGAHEITGADAVLEYAQIATAPLVTGGWEWLNSLNPPAERPEPEQDEKPRKKRRVKREGQQIILAPEPVIETGIIEVQPAWDVLVDLQAKREEAERERRKRLRAIALADDEWLMMA